MIDCTCMVSRLPIHPGDKIVVIPLVTSTFQDGRHSIGMPLFEIGDYYKIYGIPFYAILEDFTDFTPKKSVITEEFRKHLNVLLEVPTETSWDQILSDSKVDVKFIRNLTKTDNPKIEILFQYIRFDVFNNMINLVKKDAKFMKTHSQHLKKSNKNFINITSNMDLTHLIYFELHAGAEFFRLFFDVSKNKKFDTLYYQDLDLHLFKNVTGRLLKNKKEKQKFLEFVEDFYWFILAMGKLDLSFHPIKTSSNILPSDCDMKIAFNDFCKQQLLKEKGRFSD